MGLHVFVCVNTNKSPNLYRAQYPVWVITKLKMKKYLGVLLLLIVVNAKAQQTNATAGIDATGSAGSASITVGQQDYMNYSSASGYSNEGVQQPFELFATSNLWTGAISTDWNTASNWSVGVPTNTIGAIIPAATNQPVIGSGNIASADSVVIESGAILTNYGTLNLYGNFANSGSFTSGSGSSVVLKNTGTLSGLDTFANLEVIGTFGIGTEISDKVFITEKLIKSNHSFTTNDKLTLLSTATGSAMIDDEGGTLAGKAYIQHFTSGAFGYHHFSSPLSDGIVGMWGNRAFPLNGPDGAPAWTSQRGSLQYYDEVNNKHSVLDSGYYNYTNPSSALVVGQGYTAYLNSLPTLNSFGTPNNGSLSIPVTHSAGTNDPKGWNLVGNPYPSPISWKA